MWRWMPTSHQSMFYRRSLFDILGRYDRRFAVFADMEFMLRFVKGGQARGYKDVFMNRVISRASLYGFGSKRPFSSLKEREEIGDMYFAKTFSRALYFKLQWVKYLLITVAEKLGLMSSYRRVKYGLFKR